VVAGTLAVFPAFRLFGDNGYMLLAGLTGLAALAATCAAGRTRARHALWLILGVAVLLRAILLLGEPLLSTDIYRYIWDGRVQAAGINPYRHVPFHEALVPLRDGVISPKISRADYAVTIYPPVAQMFFLLVTRIGESVLVMKLALLACEGVSIGMIVLLLRRAGRPLNRLVAYAWHPLPMWEIANSGHVDALMVALMLVGLWLAVGGRELAGAAAVTLGALVKPFAVLALPVMWRPWDWRMPVLVLAIVALCYLPYASVGAGVLGFLTAGYLGEEKISSGDYLWPLAAWRTLLGEREGDVLVYLFLSAAIVAALAIRAALRAERPIAARICDVHWLLLAALLLISPNYPWYFLVAVPFVALYGGAPAWAMTLGAVLLQEEVDWDHHVPFMVRKSLFYLIVIGACVPALWRAWGRAWGRSAGDVADVRP
jgi:hypothetical protein